MITGKQIYNLLFKGRYGKSWESSLQQALERLRIRVAFFYSREMSLNTCTWCRCEGDSTDPERSPSPRPSAESAFPSNAGGVTSCHLNSGPPSRRRPLARVGALSVVRARASLLRAAGGREGAEGRERSPRSSCARRQSGSRRAAAMAAAEPTSSAQPTPQAQAQPPPPPPGAPSSQPPAALSSRHEKSLGLLTTKFVSLLQEAQDGVLDLKAVSGGGDVASGRPGRGGGAGCGAPPAGRRVALPTKSTQELALCSGLTQGWFDVGNGRLNGPLYRTLFLFEELSC